jgi:hypothetical protein
MSRWIALSALAVAACTPADGEVTGPYTGPTVRYAIDDIVIPSTTEEVTGFGADLDGDKRVDNVYGQVTRTLKTWGDDLTSGGPDMIASGAIRSLIELRADDLANDDSVAIWYVGADGDDAVPIGGRLIDGVLASNRTRTSDHRGRARLHLPVFLDADPTEIDLYGLEVDLEPDGHGGFHGFVRGGMRSEDAMEATYAGVLQMFAANPGEHKGLRELFELSTKPGNDGVITRDEFFKNSLIISLLTPDIEMAGVGKVLSFAFGVHLRACPDGVCSLPAVEDHCRDRVRDGGETDVDCGGGCLPCAASQACTAADDCQSGTCTATGCTAPTCTDGLENGFEGDIDCGGICAKKCELGQRCDSSSDCNSTSLLTCVAGTCH